MATKTLPDASADFDFYDFLFRLERALPERSKARKLLPRFEAYVYDLEARAARPWETFPCTNGVARDQATTALFESVLRIPAEHRFIAQRAVSAALALANMPQEVTGDIDKLLGRERNFCYIESFITLRLKGEVTLTDECVPVPGSIYARRSESDQ